MTIPLPAHPVARAYDRSGAPMPNRGWTDSEAAAIRAYGDARAAEERESLRAAIMAKHEAANGQHNLYHCLAVELFGDEAIRSAAPPQA